VTQAPSQEDSINIVPYNRDWPKLAEEEILIIKKTLPFPWIINIQHIGSTAIPGLAAKPIIDIYVGVTSLQEAQAAIKPIESLGYIFWSDNPNKEKMFFVKGRPPFGKQRTHHIHIVEHNSNYWQARILFRDFLRAHHEDANRYAQLKLKLMKQYTFDREAYTDAKYDFISSILKKAGFKEKVKQ
jgi:GrpB-like predicted nucleotidyltransferase (UPF0157 family)